uniref:Small ribosomal subunit protein uS4c n=2 Tax=Batophora TaxID=3139 RepID=A0A386JLR2_9CHLO|nr:30S ribosomal protein S4 [Batophora oerstedii]AYD72467.1 30S ribosomal protein S4 [Batophora occidentalis]
MSRYRGPRLRIIRRLGELPGLSNKLPTIKTFPGQHGAATEKKKKSPYFIRLKEKQKLRYNYGLTEKQLIHYVKRAKQMKGSTGEILLQLLEMRLDNVIYRFGLAPTIVAARQLISHGHILLNDQKITIPSYQCKKKDIISIKNQKNSQTLIANYQENNNKQHSIPGHLSFNKENMVGIVNQIINRNEVGLLLNELFVIEYYSR